MNWFKKLIYKIGTRNLTITEINVRPHDDCAALVELKTAEGVHVSLKFSKENALMLSRHIEDLFTHGWTG